MKTCNLFRTIAKYSDHIVNYFENSNLSLEKSGKWIEKKCNIGKLQKMSLRSSEVSEVKTQDRLGSRARASSQLPGENLVPFFNWS